MAIKKKRCRENNKGGMITSRFVCMVNLNCILAIFPECWQKVPSLSLFGSGKRPQNDKMVAKSATTYYKQRVQGKNPLLEQHFDGDISNTYLAVNLRSIKATKTVDESCNISYWLSKLNKD